MRFPRALNIRDDLTVADCMTATGAPITAFSAGALLNLVCLGILEGIRSEKKRKMDDEDE